MKKILLALLISLFSTSLFASDEKPGRFFEDQPDVNDDFQIHFIYFLAKKTKDKERDINGWIEKEVKKIDDLFFKMTGNKQRLKFDYRQDGKLDISFARMDRKARKGGWNVNYPDYYLQKQGFTNPKKMYFSFTDASSGDGGQMGPHHGYLFIGKAKGQEIIKLATANDIGTTDIQLILNGALKEAGLLVLLNKFITKKTGMSPFGTKFNVRNAPKSINLGRFYTVFCVDSESAIKTSF